MSPLEQVREAIIKAVPEIVELKFGCQVKLDGLKGYDGGVATLAVPHAGGWLDTGGIYLNPKELTIIGRPVQLADVLRAIGLKGRSIFHVYADGKIGGSWGTYKDELAWDLSKPLDQQSPETIDFLASIL